jgi:hypothetical protein
MCRGYVEKPTRPDDLFVDSDEEFEPKTKLFEPNDDEKTIQIVLSNKSDKANLISSSNQDYEFSSASFNLSFPSSNESLTSSYKDKKKTEAKSQGSGKTVRFEDEEICNPLLKKLKQ